VQVVVHMLLMLPGFCLFGGLRYLTGGWGRIDKNKQA
jgi:hypothetical protein